jgi:starvation-inducible DNA-binding protein
MGDKDMGTLLADRPAAAKAQEPKQEQKQAAQRPRLRPTKNDLPADVRERLVALGNRLLAGCLDLTYQAKQAHWNVKGPSFYGLHQLFDEVYATALSGVDLLAERVVQLGGVAEGTVRVAASRSELGEYPLEAVAGREHAEALSTALARYGHLVRVAIDEATDLGDVDTADILTEISRAFDKHVWMLEAHLEGGR